MTLTCIKMHFRDVHYSSCLLPFQIGLNIPIILFLGISPQKETTQHFANCIGYGGKKCKTQSSLSISSIKHTHIIWNFLIFFIEFEKKNTEGNYQVEKINCYSQNKISVGKNCIISNEIFKNIKKNIRKIFSMSSKKFFLKIYYFPMRYSFRIVNIPYDRYKLNNKKNSQSNYLSYDMYG